MTDHSGSKQGLWDEEADGDRPTNPGDDDATNPAIDLLKAANPDDVPTATELDNAIELLRVSIPPAEAEPANTIAGTMSPEAIDSVARFISDPGLHTQNRELDAPNRSLAALELLDGPEYGAEPTDMRAPPQPPPTPGSLRPSDDDLPSIVLGSQMSTRADQTERTRAIPATHPLANSIAPGGSAVSTPPRPRKSSRWQVTLGAAALLAIAFGSIYLQSRGEHHAASGLPGEHEEEEAVARREEPKPTEQELIARQVAEAEAARALEAEQQAEAARLAEEQRLADEAARKQAQQAETDAQERAAKASETAKKAKSMRVAVGGVRMLEREEAEAAEDGAGPNRDKVIAAMNAMTEQLKGCVGEEHGVADVTLTVRAPGVVSHALVEGAFADSPQGSCIAKALRTAKMPPFEGAVTRIEYPFQL